VFRTVPFVDEDGDVEMLVESESGMNPLAVPVFVTVALTTTVSVVVTGS
jgi:hypothetical protein